MAFEKFLVGGGGLWWVVDVSHIIASALVLLRQELRPVLENSLGQWPGPEVYICNMKPRKVFVINFQSNKAKMKHVHECQQERNKCDWCERVWVLKRSVFSVTKVTQQSVYQSVCLKAKPKNSLKSIIPPYHHPQHNIHHHIHHYLQCSI